MSMAWAPSTIRTYCSAQRQFLNFCKQFGQVNQDESILPASEITILRFIAYAGRRLSASSVRNYLSAVRNLHLVFGFPDPLKGLPRVPLVLKGTLSRRQETSENSDHCSCSYVNEIPTGFQ